MFPAVDFSDVAAVRELAKSVLGSGPKYESQQALRVEDLAIPGYQGAPEVAVRLYAPADQTGLPGLIYLHGVAPP